MSNYVKRENIVIYDNVNGQVNQEEYNNYEDPEKKIERRKASE